MIFMIKLCDYRQQNVVTNGFVLPSKINYKFRLFWHLIQGIFSSPPRDKIYANILGLFSLLSNCYETVYKQKNMIESLFVLAPLT